MSITPPAPGRAEALLPCPYLPWKARGWLVYFGPGNGFKSAGGFSVRGCPDPEQLAAQIVAAVNATGRPAPAIVAEVVRYQPAKDTHGVFLHEIGNTGKVAYAQPVVLASDYDAALRTLAEVRGELALREQTIASLRGAVAGAQADLAEVRGERDGLALQLEGWKECGEQAQRGCDAANELRNQIAAENKRLFAKNLEATQRAEQAERVLARIERELRRMVSNRHDVSLYMIREMHEWVTATLPAHTSNACECCQGTRIGPSNSNFAGKPCPVCAIAPATNATGSSHEKP